MSMKAKKLAVLALLAAVALGIFVLELQIPPIVPVPGIKLGLSNIVTVFTVFALGSRDGCAVLFVRIFLGAVFAGNFASILYSAAGGACAISITVLLRHILKKDQLWVAGCLGAMAHSVGQMAAAVILSGTPAILVYLPIMLACSILSGVFTGLCAQILVNRGDHIWKTFLK